MRNPSRQTGAFLMARALLIVGILMAMLIIPVYLKKEREDRELAVHKTELAMSRGPASAAAPAASATLAEGAAATTPRPLGHGLTYVVVNDGKAPPDVARLGCNGEPAPLDQPQQGACNPYQGDTSCRTVLPVLCLLPQGAPLPSGPDASADRAQASGTLGATQPVMGAVLESQAMASARCETELGAGWRVAGMQDGPQGSGGGSVQGVRGPGLTGYTRYWVHSPGAKANCWDQGG